MKINAWKGYQYYLRVLKTIRKKTKIIIMRAVTNLLQSGSVIDQPAIFVGLYLLAILSEKTTDKPEVPVAGKTDA